MLRTCLITIFIFIVLLNLGALNVHQGLVVGCHKAEREALLKFKQSLSDPSNRLSSWKGMGCCDWDGVGCDNVTAFVNRLDLPNPYNNIYYSEQPFSDYMNTSPFVEFEIGNINYCTNASFLIAPKIDSSLLELKHLNYLDLSCNDFQGSQIPKFIGSFKYLRYLNLSHSNFSGIVPSQLGNLTRLQTLDLSSLYDSGDLSTHALNMPPSLLVLYLSNCQFLYNSLLLSRLFSNSTWLSRIQQLDLSENSLGGTVPYVLTNMTSLTYLDLSMNELIGSIPLWLGNMTTLTYLDLSANELNDSFPLWLKNNMTSLTYLDLSSNELYSSIPLWLGNMTSLTHLDLAVNQLNGTIPLSMTSMRKLEYLDLSFNSFSSFEGDAIMDLLRNLCKLIHFDLSYNSIRGSIEANHINSYKCLPYKLEHLRLGQNMIGGMLPSWLGDFKYLRVLDISHNGINGLILISIESLSHLEELDLSSNTLSGALPQRLGQCKSLVHIDLSSNFLQGAVLEYHLDNLSRLEYLDLSFNDLEWNISSNWSPPFLLNELHLASCKIQSQFPRWIAEQTKLNRLDFSDNNIFGELNQLFPNNNLSRINISHNRITGPVPYFSSAKLEYIDLSFNLLSGSLVHHDPSAKNDIAGIPICQLNSLVFIDLQKNNISGGISDCWAGLESLVYINLSSNNLSGTIPLSMGLLSKLQFLRLSENSLHGPIPPTLSNSPLQLLDLGENKLVGNIPSNWGGENLLMLELLRLRGNQLVGPIPPNLCSLPNLRFIDLSFNNLTGSIPHCFGHLFHISYWEVNPVVTHLWQTQNLDDGTKVVLKGAELQYTKILQYFVNLDLSSNALIGSIPEEVTNLSALIGLNLSHNHLTGNIPNKIGEMTSLESLDLSNNNLSGTIPPNISALTSLVRLNLSYNKLQGEIPTGDQLQVIEDPSMTYIGNPGLCGDPLPNKCRTNRGEN